MAEDFASSRRQYGLRFRNLESGNWYPELLDNVAPTLFGPIPRTPLPYVRT